MKVNRKGRNAALGVFIALGIGFGAMRCLHGDAQTAQFETAAVRRGNLQVTISATGTVEPEDVVDVGAQVAGQIRSFGVDADGRTIDYGSAVEEGMVLALIDDSLYRADVDDANARLKRAHAEVAQGEAKLMQAERDWKRAQSIGSADALAKSSYDAYQAGFASARANLDLAHAGVAQAEAALQKAQRNLTYCTIRSPVKGVIIDRRVNIGQTVVSSLNAPSLFLIAKDLRRMELWASVNEADIANVFPGQRVKFTVDALPGEEFEGTVGKIRLNAALVQNVVTYTVEIQTDNSHGKLLPYLTANVRFEVKEIKDALLAPNAALRWFPAAEVVHPEIREKFQNHGKPGSGAAPVQITAGKAEQGRLWQLAGDYVRPFEVRVGPSDGMETVIETSELKEGEQVVLRQKAEAGSEQQAGSKNPFAPSFAPRRQ